MKTAQDIFDEIPAWQRQRFDPDRITAELEKSAMDGVDGVDTRLVQVVGPRRLEFITERRVIHFDGAEWHLAHS